MPDVRTLLSSEQIKTLRASYKREDMVMGARMAVAAPYPPAAPLVEAIIGSFYSPTSTLAPDRREQILIGAMAATGGGTGKTFAVHLYWGLMEGLSLGEIADTLLLIGAYDGIDRFSNGAGTLATLVQKVLRPALEASGDAVESVKIVRAIAATFP